MMFVQFFIWGSWYVIMSNYLEKGLGFDGNQVGLAYSATCWAAIISPFFVGMIADRFFPAQKVLALMHLLGGITLYCTTFVQSTWSNASWIFFGILMLHTLCYMPTLALVNAISMNQMKDPGKEFPGIRVLGTIGWIVVGLLIGFLDSKFYVDLNLEETSIPFKLGAIASIVMAVFCLTLPNTPPKPTGQKVSLGDIVGIKALSLMKEKSFAIFFISSILICIPLSFYYAFTNPFLNDSGMTNVVAKMTMGQMSEIIFLLVMPFFFKRLGVKWMLLVGMIAWAARYGLFVFGNNESLVFMLYAGIILHGICFDFFFVTGQIYVDQKAPKEIQANAQGLIALATYGIGMLIGAFLGGAVVKRYEITEIVESVEQIVGHNWQNVWIVPCIMAVVIILAFAVLFKENNKSTPPEVTTE